MNDSQKVYWDGKYNALLSRFLPIGLIRKCVYSIQFNDPAHNVDHVYKVCKLALKLCDQQGMSNDDTKIILAGALMHDLGCRYDRDDHHFISYGMSFTYIEAEAWWVFTDEEKLLVGRACLEHRASYKGKHTSVHSMLVALADRGVPDIDLYIKRAILFRLDKGLDDDILREEVYKHLLEKFSPGTGNVWNNYPSLGLELWQNEWEQFNATLLDSEACIARIAQLHEQLKL